MTVVRKGLRPVTDLDFCRHMLTLMAVLALAFLAFDRIAAAACAGFLLTVWAGAYLIVARRP